MVCPQIKMGPKDTRLRNFDVGGVPYLRQRYARVRYDQTIIEAKTQ